MNIVKLVKSIEEILAKKDMNMSDFANETGVSDGTLSKLIRYRIHRPTDATIEAIARVVGVDPLYFYDQPHEALSSPSDGIFLELIQKLRTQNKEQAALNLLKGLVHNDSRIRN